MPETSIQECSSHFKKKATFLFPTMNYREDPFAVGATFDKQFER